MLPRPIYRLSTLVAPVVGTPALLAYPRTRDHLAQRFGSWNIEAATDVLWFHGASVGEIGGLAPIIAELRERSLPQILVTATSSTGMERGSKIGDISRLLPFDNAVWISRALRNLRPQAFIFGEVEIWPELLRELAARDVPAYMVNARFSERMARRVSHSEYLRSSLTLIKLFLVGGEADRERLLECGVADGRIQIVGNAKYDVEPVLTEVSEIESYRVKYFRNDDPSLVLGSLRLGEEKFWFPEIYDAFSRGLKFNLVVAPRRPEHFDLFAESLRRYQLPFRRWTAGAESRADSRIVLLDTLGELSKAYAFADLSFIGGSMVDFGGHNPFEAAACGSAVAIGQFTRNVELPVAQLLTSQALLQVTTRLDVARCLRLLADSGIELAQLGERAKLVWQNSRGAAERIAKQLIAAGVTK